MNIAQAEAVAYREGYQDAIPLPDLISPSDVIDGADSWDEISDETLDREVSEATSVYMSENNLSGVVRELAVKMWAADLPRAPIEDLVFDSREKAVENGYWPYKMGKYQVQELLWERDIPSDVYHEAYGVVSAGFYDGTHPREEPRYD